MTTQRRGAGDERTSAAPVMELDSAPKAPRAATAWRLNWRWLVGSGIVVAVCAPAGYFWHAYQVSRQAYAMRDRADRLANEERWEQAATAYHHYLQLRPDDHEALLRRAEAFDKLTDNESTLPQAVSLYSQAVRSNRERTDARLRLAELLLESNRAAEAAEQARLVAQAEPENRGAARTLAQALLKQLGPAQRVSAGDVVQSMQEDLVRFPGDRSLSESLAEVLRTHQDLLPADLRRRADATADATMNAMVVADPGSADALLSRFRYRSRYALAGAADDLAAARELAPNDPWVLESSALEFESIDRERAQSFGQRLVEAAPGDRRGYLTLAMLYVHWGQPERAIDILKQGMDRVGGDDLPLTRLLLLLLLSTSATDEARTILARFDPMIRQRAPYLAAPIQRRLDEELEFAHAQIWVQEGRTADALPVLKRLTANVTESSDPAETLVERQRRAQQLAQAYSQTGLHDLAAATYEELTRLSPQSTAYRLRAAAEWRDSGDLNRAIRVLDGELLDKSVPSAVWLSLAEARLELQSRRPATEPRDWSGVDAALAAARAGLGDDPTLLLLEAQARLSRNEHEPAREALARAAAAVDIDRALLPRLALLQQAAGEDLEAQRTLERYATSGADPELVADARASFFLRKGDIAQSKAELERAVEQAGAAGRLRILRRLVSLEIQGGDIDSARRRLDELRTEKAPEFWVYVSSSELALIAGDIARLQECDSALEALEGPNGTLWRYYRALRLLEDKPGGSSAKQSEAAVLATQIEGLRPSWPDSLVLRGRIAERQSNFGAAIDNYRKALQSGARNLTTVQWLIAALYRENRFSEAAAIIGQVSDVAVLAPELAPSAIQASLQTGRLDEAVRLAQAASELQPGDLTVLLRYAQTLAAAERPAEAERAYRKALRQAPKDQRAWNGMIWFYSVTGKRAEGRKLIKEMLTSITATEQERTVAQARASEILGDRQEAAALYQRAVEAQPDDARLLEEVGRFYFRFDYTKAREAYEQVLSVDPQSGEARRTLAALVGLQGAADNFQNALSMLQRGPATGVQDRRLEMAMLLIAGVGDLQGGRDFFEKAAAIGVDLVDSQERPEPSDRVLLARACESLGRIDEAESQWTKAVDSYAAPELLAPMIEFLTRHDRLDQAESRLARLEAIDPASPRTLRLRVTLLQRSGPTKAVVAAIEQFVATQLDSNRSDSQKSTVLTAAADMLTRIGAFDAAESKLRELTRRFPLGYQPLAQWLAERERFDDALAVCREHFTTQTALENTRAFVSVLTIAASRSRELSGAEAEITDRFDAARRSGQVDARALLELGVLRVMQGRDAEAVTLYEEALAQQPQNLAVLNNLALVLVELPERRGEALPRIDQALAGAPSSSDMLDSKALVLIGMGRCAEARELLERLCQTNPLNPQFRLHLAMCLAQLKDFDLSRAQMARSRLDGLQLDALTPSERRLLAMVPVD